jgi:outer membrane protein assembly factor BamD (BamD/ComL family)
VLSSTLEREVALLDAVRSALTQSDFDRSLELIAQYRREFEHGELARDADVFEIEAFTGRGERARAVRAAEAFLRRHPQDPHASRLRALID